MNKQARQVEKFMLALGQNVRSTPVDALNAYESITRLELMYNKIWELASALGIQVRTFPSLSFREQMPKLKPDQVLQRLSELHYLLIGTYLALGQADLIDPAFEETHSSNMTRIWADGKVHKEQGLIVNPPDFHPPRMRDVIAAHSLQPTLFSDPKPTEVIQDQTFTD